MFDSIIPVKRQKSQRRKFAFIHFYACGEYLYEQSLNIIEDYFDERTVFQKHCRLL